MYSGYLGYCAPDFSLLCKLNSFFSLALFSISEKKEIYNRGEKKLTNNVNWAVFQRCNLFFCCQGQFKYFLENYRFCQKSGNDAYSRGWGNHVVCVIMRYCVRKSICDSPLKPLSLHSFTLIFFYLFLFCAVGWFWDYN